MKYIDLFAGVGGFRYGIEQAYLEKKARESDYARSDLQNIKSEWGEWQHPVCVYSNEWDKYANSVYRKHYGECDNRDIRTVRSDEIPDFDLLCGGFPCQAFSIAGKRRGFEDTRGTLFFEIARILRDKRPRLCLLENVKGLLSHGEGKTFETIISTLDELGYDCQWQVLNSKNFGVPQNRERVFIIGHLRGTSRPQVFPRFTLTGQDIHGVAIANTIDANYYKGINTNPGHASSTRGILDGAKIRRLTPVECERLQGFPDNFTKYGANGELISDTQRYKMMGNAVTTNVVTAIIEGILKENKNALACD